MADNDTILGQVLDKLDDISDLKLSVGVLVEQTKQIQRSQETLNAAINGNGKPGLMDRVRNLEVALEEHKLYCPIKPIVEELRAKQIAKEQADAEKEKERKERAKEWRNMQIGLISSIVMFVLSTLANIFLK